MNITITFLIVRYHVGIFLSSLMSVLNEIGSNMKSVGEVMAVGKVKLIITYSNFTYYMCILLFFRFEEAYRKC